MSVKNVTAANFDKEVLNSKVPVLIDFWASWCGPCRMASPIIDQLADEVAGKAIVGKINVDEEEELARQFSVMSIPTMIVFKDGKPIERISGLKDKNYYKRMLGV